MAKRLSDTDRYSKAFYKSLPGPYKLLWDYLCANCDNAGIWIKDFEVAQIRVGKDMPITESGALVLFKERIVIFDNSNKWFIPSFIEFQYDCTVEGLKENNNAHLSVIKKLKKEGLYGGPIRGAQDKDIDKYKDKVIDKDKYITVDNEKITDVIRVLESYEAPLNGRQREHSLRNWRDVAGEWFEQSLHLDFNDQKHVFNSFSKYFIHNGRAPNGSSRPEPPKLTLNDLKP
jgi:hypothetical protein